MTPTPDPHAALRRPVTLALFLGGLAVVAGAYAAHGLPKVRDAHAVELWRTASVYQLIHAALALGAWAAAPRLAARWAVAGVWAVVAGQLLFGGALYALGWWGPSLLGAVAPLGGSAFILAWVALAIGVARGRPSSSGADT